jgi:hypothetical protein
LGEVRTANGSAALRGQALSDLSGDRVGPAPIDGNTAQSIRRVAAKVSCGRRGGSD